MFILPSELNSAIYEYQLDEITENDEDIVMLAISFFKKRDYHPATRKNGGIHNSANPPNSKDARTCVSTTNKIK